MSGGGFGKWFDEQKQSTDLEAGGSNCEGGDEQSPWAQMWSAIGSEKKDEGGENGDPAESQSFLDSMTTWADGVKSSTAEATGMSQQESTLFGLSYQTRFKGFVATLFASGFFFFMAFAVGMPVIVLRPSKFALCFTVASLLFMSSFALLKGPYAHFMSMIALDRLPFTLSYIGSMAITLYAALVVRSYIFVVVTSSMQIATLAYYFLSFIPGGTAGARVFMFTFMKTANIFLKASVTVFKGCLKMVSS
jgi:hypothetical protein